MNNPFKKGRSSEKEDNDESERKSVSRPAPQRLLYQPQDFEKGLDLLLEHKPSHPSGKDFLRILQKNFKGRDLSGLQTFISSKMKNEIMNGTFNKKLSKLSASQRLYIDGDYMKNWKGFIMPPSSIPIEDETDDEIIESSPQASVKRTASDSCYRPPLDIKKSRLFETPMGRTETEKSAEQFKPLWFSTPTFGGPSTSKAGLQKKSIREEFEIFLKDRQSIFKVLVKEYCDEYLSKKNHQDEDGDRTTEHEEHADAERSDEVAPTRVNSANQPGRNDEESSAVTEEPKSVETGNSSLFGLSNPTTSRICLEAMERSEGSCSVTMERSAEASGSVTSSVSTSVHVKDLTDAKDGNSSEEDEYAASMSTITYVEIYKKKSVKRERAKFTATPTKKGFKLSLKESKDWSTSAAPGSVPNGDVNSTLLADVSLFDIRSALDTSVASIDALKVSMGKRLETKMGQIVISADKKIPALIVVKDE